jgi:membrane protein DedA with SNARE-associated domain
MLNVEELVGHWGYPAIIFVMVLGNLGIPVPEESILMLAGYLVWRGQLRFGLVVVIGISSGCLSDNLGYYIGRRYGGLVMERLEKWLLINPERFDTMRRFMARYGPLSVFSARFVAGLRFMAGPMAGTSGMPYRSFFLSSLLGGLFYVPMAVGIGYGIGLGFGDQIERLERTFIRVEHLVLIGAAAAALGIIAYRVHQARRRRVRSAKTPRRPQRRK